MATTRQTTKTMHPSCAHTPTSQQPRPEPVDNFCGDLASCGAMDTGHSRDLCTTSSSTASDPHILTDTGAGTADRSSITSVQDMATTTGRDRTGDIMNERITALALAFACCTNIRRPSKECERLWLAMKEAICTRARCFVTPLGSSAPVEVTDEYAGLELAEAMTWLRHNEDEARTMDEVALYRRLRAAATKGANGSARMAQQDALHGITGVRPGDPLTFVTSDIDL